MDQTDAQQRLDSDDTQHIVDQTLLRSSTPMSYLSAPVPDFAGSLLAQSGDTDEANTTFLRESLSAMSAAPPRTSSIDHSRDPRLGISRRAHNASTRGTSPTQRDRLQRYLTHLYRMHNPPAPVAAAYSNRTPSPTRQSIYDWAPATADDTPARSTGNTNGQGQPQDTSPAVIGHSAEARIPDGQRSSDNPFAQRRSSRSRERHRSRRSDAEGPPSYTPPSHHEESFNATESMLRYFIDRERSGLSVEEERARGTGWYRPDPPRPSNSGSWSTSTGDGSRPTNVPRQPVGAREQQEGIAALRRGLLSLSEPSRTANGSPRTRPTAAPSCSGTLENAVKYLDSLRRCDCYDDALAAAIDLNLTTKDLFASKHDEFLLDIEEVEPLCQTSWIQPGAVFEGHQFASTAILPRARHSSTTSVEQINPNFHHSNDHPPGSTHFTAYRNPHTSSRAGLASRTQGSTSTTTPGSLLNRMSNYDYWPVRMVIHAVDTGTMTLQGSMEAYDVPQHPLTLDAIRAGTQSKAGKKHAPITTYVEGHIIDFHNHSFMTPRASSRPERRGRNDTTIFPAATPSKDAENWRKLAPFNELSEDDMADLLLSKDRLDALNKEFVFMRWKERCFVHGKNDTCLDNERRTDHDRGHGLTISGFYYISLRRSDGSVEGIYYDPHSTPYQHLRLKGLRATWPSLQFR